MSKDHLSKKELRANELQDALQGAADYVETHKDQTLKWLGIGLGAVALVGGIWGGLSWRTNRLNGRLSEALSVFEAPIQADGVPPVAAGGKIYKDAAERTAEARKQLEALAKDAPSSTAGKAAALVVVALDGKKDVSTATLDGLREMARSDAGSMAAGAAAAAVLDAKVAAGQTKEAIEIGKKFLESTVPPLPKDVLIFKLAELYEKSGQPAEAKSFYRRVVDDYPDSPMKWDAQSKVSSL